MSSLIIFIGKDDLFEEEVVKHALEKIPGVTSVEEKNIGGAKLQCAYSVGADTTLARLLASLKQIAVDGTGDISLGFVLEFKRIFPKPLHLIDSSYSFDVSLSAVDSLNDLKRTISGN